tara:strand:+ start:1182 stop:1514 length:333 start_codon:yes stop_codon:yes gene_type:complete
MSVQDILLQQAMQDNQNKPDPAVAMGVGGSGAALLGVLGGRGARSRMAGGLGGLILGGGLGAGMAKMMQQSSPAGDMLARIQANGGNLNTMDKMRLEQILAASYNNMGIG